MPLSDLTQEAIAIVARRIHEAYCSCGGYGTTDYQYAKDKMIAIATEPHEPPAEDSDVVGNSEDMCACGHRRHEHAYSESPDPRCCACICASFTLTRPHDGPPVDEVNAPAVVRLVREALDGTMGDDQVYEAAKLVSREWMRQKLTTEGLIPVPTDGAPS